jgi:dipeptidyl-peptidase-4
VAEIGLVTRTRLGHVPVAILVAILVATLLAVPAGPVRAQGASVVERLRALPGYDRHEALSWQIPGSVALGEITATWAADSSSFDYTFRGRRWRFDVGSRRPTPIDHESPFVAGGAPSSRWGSPLSRRTAATSVTSPGGARVARVRDRNIWIHALGRREHAITADGSASARVSYGTAPRAYSELRQHDGMWWSPSGRHLAYYRVDERGVPDHPLRIEDAGGTSHIETITYPEPGKAAAIVDLFVYDVQTMTHTRLDVRDGRPETGDSVGYYVYRVSWSPDGTELLLHRANRGQNVMELAACAPGTGACRVVVHEAWPTGWVSEPPPVRWCSDGRRFVWTSARTGFANLYLYDLTGARPTALTTHAFEVTGVVDLDEHDGVVYYLARDGDNFMKPQLHSVKLDGTNERRLTNPAFMHSVQLSPDRRFFVDVAQAHDTPPITYVVDARTGETVAEVATSDLTTFNRLGLKTLETFTYLASDGRTPLYGSIQFPSNFDPSKRYPVLVPVYGGPESSITAVTERFTVPSPTTEYGLLIVTLSSRAAPGMGKRTLDAIHRTLGQADVDDLAAGIASLSSRPYVDRARIGVYGTSYGGYTAAMLALRYPALVAAASASSPVTAWEHYNAIYAERYMGTPQDNPEGYRLGSPITHAANLDGRLLLYFGTADHNVHPSHALALVRALERANKRVEVHVGTGEDHTSVGYGRMMEFFLERLIGGRS